MALQKNKVKFGLNKVHYAKITAYCHVDFVQLVDGELRIR